MNAGNWLKRVSLVNEPVLDALQQAAGMEIKAHARGLLTAVWSGQSGDDAGYTVAVGPEGDGGMTIEAFWETVRQLRNRSPYVTEIWFVDCPHHYHDFVNTFPQALPGSEAHRTMTLRIDIQQWESRFFDPETEVIARPDDDVPAMLRRGNMEKIIWPWICAEPGVWVHWSDGRYQQVVPGA